MTGWILSPAARGDLVEIWNYTADRWGTEQADNYVEGIRWTLSQAALNSPLCRQIYDVRRNYWRIRSGRHICYFKRLSNDYIDVIRIMHERMDVKGQIPE